MEHSEATYNVVIVGELLPGFEPQQVKDMFGRLFKLPPEKTSRLLDKSRVLKRGVDLTKANNLKKKIEQIGLVVRLDPCDLQTGTETKPKTESVTTTGLSLVPMGKEADQEKDATINNVTCPKCGTEQSSSIEECQDCGVILHKAFANASESVAPSTAPKPVITSTVPSSGLTTVGLVASSAAALVGALIWKGIAMMLGFEFGIIAWGIGGVIGFVMAVSGGRGQSAAIICGVLALLAIMGGKYMVLSELRSQIGDVLAESSDTMQHVYKNEIAAAKVYTEVSGGKELHQFMVDYGYSVASDAQYVSEDEVAEFQENIEPRLKSYAYAQPDYDMWYRDTIENDLLMQLSPMELMKESFGLIDLLFLFLGISTAARLGYGMESG